MTTLVLLIAFIGVMIGVGIWGMKKTTSISDFVIAGRSVGPWILALSFGTSYFSAVVFIGFAGKLGWLFGLEVLWIALGNTLIGAMAAWLVLGRRTRRMSHNLNAMTMPEFFEARYGSSLMKIIAAVIIFIFLLPYSASVFKGLGHLFEVNFGISYITALLAMTALTAIYLVLGGYIAASRTDFIQGIIMIVGSIVLVCVFVIKSGYGPVGIFSAVQEQYIQHSDKVIPAGPKKQLILWSLVFMTSFGTWGLPQMVQKFYAIKDEKMIGRGAVVTMVFAVIVVTAAYFIGALSHLYFTDPEGRFDRIVPEMLTQTLPEPLMALMLLLILSASMSTLASLVLVSSSAVVVDLFKVHTREGISEGRRMLIMRCLTLVFMALSAGLAIYAEKRGGFIVDLMSLSWGTVAGAFMAPYLYGLYARGTTTAGAFTGMLCGVALAIGLFFLWGSAMLPVAATIAMITPLIIIPVVSLFTAKLPAETIAHAFDGIDEEAGVSPTPAPDPQTA